MSAFHTKIYKRLEQLGGPNIAPQLFQACYRIF